MAIQQKLAERMYELLPHKTETVTCYKCLGYGKEICTNPDHSFLENVVSHMGANESACPVCGHDEYGRTKYDCHYCSGTGVSFEPLRLADVLIAINVKCKDDLYNYIITTLCADDTLKLNYNSIEVKYNLSKDNILDQSGEFCQFVYDLIK